MLPLHRRIMEQPRAAAANWAAQLPVAPMPMTMPLSVVEITADGISIEQAQPIYAARGGAPIPATGRGEWDQLHAAGRP